MKGLEISEVFLSELEYSKRIDSEYYRPEFIHYENLLHNKGCGQLSEFSDFLIGPFGSAFKVENYTDDTTYRYIRGKDVKPMRLMDNDNVYMPRDDFERLSRYALKKNDILVSVVGTLGNAAIIEESDVPAIFSCKSTALRTKSINPRYLLTYLNSKHGRNLLLRKERGAIQKGLNLDDLKTLTIYKASGDFQKKVDGIYRSSSHLINFSASEYDKAEETLIKSIGFINFKINNEKSNVKLLQESFIQSGRLDAEHYQAQYDDIEAKIKAHKGGYTTIGELVHGLMNGAEVREYQDEGIPYLRVGDLKQLDIDADSVVRIDPAAAEKGLEKIPLHTGDVLVSRSGSLAVTAVVEPAWKHALISSHLIRLRIADKRIDPYFLALYLSCLPGKKQIIKWSNGGVQPEINQPSLSQILVPVVDADTQKQIRENILKSRRLRQESGRLLEVAKRAVEIAIEQDEAAGLAYIQEHTKGYAL